MVWPESTASTDLPMTRVNRDCYLGIETSGMATGVALVRAGELLHEQVRGSKTGHDELLLPLLAEALAASGIAVANLAGIGVTIGPGMFTALRVGLSTAKGLALAHGLPVKGINTLWALAVATGKPAQPVLAVVDARKSQVYAALYRDGKPLIAPSVLTPAELAGLFKVRAGQNLALVGDGSNLCLAALREAGIETIATGVASPPPRIIALAAARALQDGDGDDIEMLEPLYLRRTDAELNREKKS